MYVSSLSLALCIYLTSSAARKKTPPPIDHNFEKEKMIKAMAIHLFISLSFSSAADTPITVSLFHFYCEFILRMYPPTSVTRKKSPKVYKSCPKMISLEKLDNLTPLQKLPKNVGDLGKLLVAKGY